ncbi:MAG: hypothetical protein EOM17_17005, partial [Synergistales bacterium]|nr:hypothetical protein [Synergistales bacterium]
EKAAQNAGRPLLIIIDTVARSMVGGDENSAKDVSIFIDRVDALRRKYGSSALLVHHSGIMDKGRLRGSSAWKGALDAEYLISSSGPEGLLVTVECKKMKDAPQPAPFSFEAVEYVVLEGKTGKEYTSLALKPTDEKPTKTKDLSKALKRALDSYHAAAKEKGLLDKQGKFVGVRLEDWRPYFYETATAESKDGKRKAFNRARDELVDKGILTPKNDVYLPVQSVDTLLVNEYAKRLKNLTERDSGTERDISVTCPAANDFERDNRDIIYKDVPCPGRLSGSEGEEKNTSLPRGPSLSELASRAGVSQAAVQEELDRWKKCGRLKEDGDGTIHLLAGTS